MPRVQPGAVPLVLDSDGEVGQYTSLAVVYGFPAISYSDLSNLDLKYVQANDAQGSAWGTPQVVDTVGNVGEYTSLADVNGFPAISYADQTNSNQKYMIP